MSLESRVYMGAGALLAAELRTLSCWVIRDLSPAAARLARPAKPERIFSPRAMFTQGFPWQDVGSPSREVTTLVCVCKCFFYKKGSDLASHLTKIVLLKRKHCVGK